MGGQASTALAVAVVPHASEAIMEDTLFQMLAGALSTLGPASCTLVGGHSCEGSELSLGASFAYSYSVKVADAVNEHVWLDAGKFSPDQVHVSFQNLWLGPASCTLVGGHSCEGAELSLGAHFLALSSVCRFPLFSSHFIFPDWHVRMLNICTPQAALRAPWGATPAKAPSCPSVHSAGDHCARPALAL